jgi:hypothetical protein
MGFRVGLARRKPPPPSAMPTRALPARDLAVIRGSAIIRERRNRRIDKLASLSLYELELLIKDRKISPAVRFNAIKLSLALAGHVEPKAPETDEDDGKRVAEMSLAELDAFLAEGKTKRANAAKPVIDVAPLEGGQDEPLAIEDGSSVEGAGPLEDGDHPAGS